MRNNFFVLLYLSLLIITNAFSSDVRSKLIATERLRVLPIADSLLSVEPVTVTASYSPRSAGGRHDFFSEGDYWWPDPKDSTAPYVQRDGMTNPDNFLGHRRALMNFSVQAATLSTAYVISGDEKYARQAIRHFRAWFIDPETRMNPHLLYAQAIKGRATGRGTGIIDTIHLIEIARAIEMLESSVSWERGDLEKVKQWFREYLLWLTTHKYGIDEKNAKNNHGTFWVFQVAAFAHLVRDEQVMADCRDRFKNVLLPDQMASDGSFPLELKRTKPYGYSLFNLEGMVGICQILSTEDDNLWKFRLPDGRSIHAAIGYMAPFIKDRKGWTLPADVMYNEYWPVRQMSLLFAGDAYKEKKYIEIWKSLPIIPNVEEIIRNCPLRQPLLWITRNDRLPDVRLLDAGALLKARKLFLNAPVEAKRKLRGFLKKTEKSLTIHPFSVMDKKEIPPSGDKHDYMSIAPYWWPDSSKPDGLPYIRKDGLENPDRDSIGDRRWIGLMTEHATNLALAYYLTRDERYAAKAVDLLRTWFLDDPTKMNPNLDYSQAIPGMNEGRGTGIIETYSFSELVDAISLLKGSRPMTGEITLGLRQWFEKYLIWLRASKNGVSESEAKNNHGSTYDVQVSAIALYLGQDSVARDVLSKVKEKRIARQIEPDGTEPLELVRTKSWGYSVFNITALVKLSLLGEYFGYDIWNDSTADGRSIRKCIDWLKPYAAGEKHWTYPQIVPFEAGLLSPVLRYAAVRYRDPGYAAVAQKASPFDKNDPLLPVLPEQK